MEEYHEIPVKIPAFKPIINPGTYQIWRRSANVPNHDIFQSLRRQINVIVDMPYFG
jgi:hypothetical protein